MKIVMMLSAATFVLALSANGAAENASKAAGSPQKDWPQLEEIVLVFKTHFDIGYTDMAAAVVQRYRTTMIDSALEVVDDSRSLPKEHQFAWTIPGWPMAKILEDWEGQTAERKQRVMDAFRNGRFVVHGLPFTTHTETLSEEDLVRGLSYSTELCRAAGLPLPRDAKMTDVPCHSWIMPTLLAHAGIEFLHVGTNSGSSDPRLPLLHFREGPDGSRVLTMHVNGYGTGYLPPEDWPYKTWLGLIHTGDNHGPPRPEEVRRLLREIGERLPGVKVRIGRLSDFADAIRQKEKPGEIPVVRGDTPDTWIHGPMCDPQGRIAARRTQANLPAAQLLSAMLEAWGVGSRDPDGPEAPRQSVAEAYEQSLLYGEHTWGASLGWVGHALPWGPEWLKHLDERHARMVASWDEHRAYAHNAFEISRSLLDAQLERLSRSVAGENPRAAVFNPLPWKRSGLARIDGEICSIDDVPALGYRTIVAGASNRQETTRCLPQQECKGEGVLENAFFRVVYDRAIGSITSIVDKKSRRQLVRPDSKGFGSFLYERFSAEQCDQFMCDYNLVFPKWVTTQFTKPDLPRDVPYRATRPTSVAHIIEREHPDYRAAEFVYENDPGLPCRKLQWEIRLFTTTPAIDIALAIDGKRPDSWPEAGWMALPLNIDRPNFRLSRLGGIVDPAQDIIPGSNRHLLWLHHGMAVFGDDDYGVGICPIDAPAVSLGEPGCWRFSWDYIPKEADVFVNLFNNQWTTNFRLWNEGAWRQTVRLWTFDRYDPESSLIRPALETRFPMIAVSVPGGKGGGALPLAKKGLEVSSQNVLVTSFGIDPQTRKWMLRLWEQAGKDGPCTVAFPEGLTVRTVQRCDLRGHPIGERLPVEDGRLQINVGRYAPSNFELTPER